MLDNDESENSQEPFQGIINNLASQESGSELFFIPCKLTLIETKTSEGTGKSVAKSEMQMCYEKEMKSNLMR